jgi:predicted RNase H-like nuclease
MSTVGVDACRKGWFAVCLSRNNGWAIDIFTTIRDLWNTFQKASLILIDIPIGLPEKGKRHCDIDARKILKQRATSLFPVPSRQAIHAKNYQNACRMNKKILGIKLSIQTWNISGKIREVDDLLMNDEKARCRVRESHPEICFWALAGGQPMKHYKKTDQGFAERRKVLKKKHPFTNEIVDTAMNKFYRKDLAKDDILDAMALAVSAAAPPESLKTIPKNPAKDSKGLPMEIVYFGLKIPKKER